MLKYLCLFFGCCSILTHAQISNNNLPNDCISAITVCGSEEIVSNSSGAGVQELQDSNACNLLESNSIWLRLEIIQAGNLGFDLEPESSDMTVDYDFFLFGPEVRCDSIGQSIRCSTTNPLQAGLTHNRTGMNNVETDLNEGPGPNGNSYVKSVDVSPGEVYFLVIDRPEGKSPFRLNWTGSAMLGNGAFKPGPDARKAPNLEKCSLNGSAAFDLDAQTSFIHNDPNLEISYHLSRADAVDHINVLLSPYTSNIPYQKIFARVYNPFTKCFSITDFDLTISGAPNIASPPTFSLCDTGGNQTEVFNLQSNTTEILNGLNNSDYNISFHLTENEAKNATNALPTNYNSGSRTIYSRVEDKTDVDCFSVVPVELELYDLPTANDYTLVQCDIDLQNSTDGITTINLEQAINAIGGGNTDLEYFFYESIAAQNANTFITNITSYINAYDNQLLYVKTVNDNGCENFAELRLDVDPTFSSLDISKTYYQCDTKTNPSQAEASFDLEIIRAQYPGLDVYIYATREDAAIENKPLSGIYTTSSTTIFVRLESNNNCEGVEQIELKVQPTPEVNIDDHYLLCTNAPPLQLSAALGFDRYRWVKIVGNSEQEVGQQINVDIQEIGNYRLYLSYIYNNDGEMVHCESKKDFSVGASNNATIEEIRIRDLQSNNTIEILVSGEGNYEYSLDEAFGPYQNSNYFENIAPGLHRVYIRDKNGCGLSEREIAIIGYPKFFSPNGDGINDYWQILGVNENFHQKTEVYIYDRFGKVLAQLNQKDWSWDGFFEGKPLPASDYWFRIFLEDGREYQGHFSLLR
ncbi:MAG: T9SS type B sorting domain-containing protein [Flavobacteriaceae bacterium]|nr:T9SS type B sorting domain-containing protein [Flavobacteriaceae bacterium]